MQTIERETFLNQLDSVRAGLSARELVEQSACFVFSEGRVFTYNDEIACSHAVEVKLTGAVRAAPLCDLLSKMTNDTIQLDVEGSELVIKEKGKTARFVLEKEILLPIDSIEPPAKWRKLPPKFGEAVALTVQSASRDSTRFAYTCIHLTKEYIEATDNAQAFRYRMKLPIKGEFLVRRDSLKHVSTIGMDKISVTENWVHFSNGSGLRLSCRKNIDEYKSLDQFFALRGEEVSLPRGLTEAAERASIFSGDSADEDLVLVELKPNRLLIRGIGVIGSYVERKAVSFKGDPFSFNISPQLLMEIMKRLQEGKKKKVCDVTGSSLHFGGEDWDFVACLSEPSQSNGDE